MGNFLGFQTLTQKMLLLVFWKFCRIIDYVLLADSFTGLSCTQGIMFIMFLKKTFFYIHAYVFDIKPSKNYCIFISLIYI